MKKVIRKNLSNRPIGKRRVVSNILIRGSSSATFLVVCDAPSVESFKAKTPLPKSYAHLFADYAKKRGMSRSDFVFVSACPPMPASVQGSDSAEFKWLQQHRDDFKKAVSELKFKGVIALGTLAAKQFFGKAVKITKVRGQVMYSPEFKAPFVAMMSPGQVLRQPHYLTSFRADFDMVAKLRDAKFNHHKLSFSSGTNYNWMKASQLIKYIKKHRNEDGVTATCLDTETVGGSWWQGAVPICASFSCRPGEGFVVPLSLKLIKKSGLYGTNVSDVRAKKILAYNWKVMRNLLEKEKYGRIQLTGHNLKYDLHVMRNAGVVIPRNLWAHDSMQLAFVADENLQSKDLASVTKIWYPARGGYSDEFEASVDYSRMDLVPPQKLMKYAAADPDTSLYLTKRLISDTKGDAKNFTCYSRIQMPALRMFVDVERNGIKIDRDKLRELTEFMRSEEARVYDILVENIDGAIKRKHYDPKKKKNGLSFTRDELVRDILFNHPKGLGLEPFQFTKTGLASTAKTHLPYFDHEPWVQAYLEYGSIEKMLSTYIGDEETGKGMWKYMDKLGEIHPSYLLHATVTGRTSSRDPNGQNFPKRGPLAKAYRRIFVPRPGYVFLEADLSQAELRVAAWMAMERTMIKIYSTNGDIHVETAMAVLRISREKWDRMTDDERKEARQKAKAVNFGFLYGMGWRKFSAYAKISYGVDISDKEAERIRNRFFELYPRLRAWHNAMREFVRERAFVRAKHGARRNLPDIFSVDEAIRASAERQAINSPVQRLASDLGLIGAIRFHRDCDPKIARIVAFIHDALIVEVKKEHAMEVAAAMKWYMQTPPLKKWFDCECPLPIISDVSIGENLADMKELKDLRAKKPKWFTRDDPPELALAA